MLLVMGGVLLSTMDSGMVNVALPTMMRDLRVELAAAGLVVSGYLLTVTATLLLWGRLADSIGRGRLYLFGLPLFAVGAMACAFSSSFPLLLCSRSLQALGASMLMATGPAIIRQAFPVGRLGRSIGLVGIATAVGLLAGPLVGGLLLSHFSWRAVFLLPVPLCTLAFLFGRRLFPARPRQRAASFDWRGSCCWLAMVLLWVVAVHRLDLFSLPLLLLAALLLRTFIRLEGRLAAPLLPLSLFTDRSFWVAVVTAALSFAVLFAVMVLLPFYLEYILARPALVVGQVLLAGPASLIVVSPWAGRLYDRIGARFLTTAGLAMSSLSLAAFATMTAATPIWLVAVQLALLGTGQAVFLTPNSASVLARVEEGRLGVAAAILATARNLGMVSGAALALSATGLLFARLSGGVPLAEFQLADHGAALLAALRWAFAGAAAVALLGTFLSLLRRR